MIRQLLIFSWAVAALTTWSAAAADPARGQTSPPAKTGAETFDQTIAPILAAQCLTCHSGSSPRGKLDLSQKATAFRASKAGAVIVAGDLKKSLLWEQIDSDEMPPKHPLSAAEKKTIRDWIVSGAEWGSDPINPFRVSSSRRAGYDWWSLQPLKEPSVPVVDDPSWSRNEIDRFILTALKKQGISPSQSANPRTLVRRLYIDLIGLPPPVEVMDHFEKNPSTASWEKLVDGLLASKEYGERWARHWLDVVRFGESDGYEYNSPRQNAWHYRDWVIRAFNDDMPYDQFVRMQIAGDVIKPNTVEGAAAVGLLVAGTHNPVQGVNAAMKLAARHDELEEITGTVAQTFLGLTVHCARCHDHKFDPISTREYYSFAAALDGVNHGETKHRAPSLLQESSKQREALISRRTELHKQLVEQMLAQNETISTTANQLRMKDPIDANDKGKTYRVSLKLAPSTWASAAQATGDQDGVTIQIVGKDGTVLASHSYRAGAWNGGKAAATFQSQSFEYTGDGKGPAHIRLLPFPLHSDHFGGAVDDLEIVEIASKKTVFTETFDKLKQRNTPGKQADTGRRVFFGAVSDRWDSTGTNAIHAVEHTDGNLALQLFSGAPGGLLVKAQSPEQKQQQAEIDALDRQLIALNSANEVAVHSVVARNPGIMRVLLRGEVTRPGDEVAPGGITAIGNVSPSFGIDKAASDEQRRKSLANWISHRDNGPFHRVMVNRTWQQHFGQGIVTSPSDLGFSGGRPSHPHLLDWLAIRFREDGYSIKKLHKRIVTSMAYQQSSQLRPQVAAIDGGNRFLWRQNPRRIEGETLRDSILDIAGQLNRTPFGLGYRDVKIVEVPPAFYYMPIDPIGSEFNRRTIYRWNIRGQRSALLDTFDCPDPSTRTPTRMVTTTPSQALSQWNDSFILRMSEKLSERIISELRGKEKAQGPQQQVIQAWRLVLGRSPTAEESAKSVRFVEAHGLPLLCRVLFNSNEFVLID